MVGRPWRWWPYSSYHGVDHWGGGHATQLGRRQGSWPLLAWPLVGLRCRPALAIVPRGLDLDLRLSTTHATRGEVAADHPLYI